jgi:hypothetical protein
LLIFRFSEEKISIIFDPQQLISDSFLRENLASISMLLVSSNESFAVLSKTAYFLNYYFLKSYNSFIEVGVS